jgi:hypothetical protein
MGTRARGHMGGDARVAEALIGEREFTLRAGEAEVRGAALGPGGSAIGHNRFQYYLLGLLQGSCQQGYVP